VERFDTDEFEELAKKAEDNKSLAKETSSKYIVRASLKPRNSEVRILDYLLSESFQCFAKWEVCIDFLYNPRAKNY
jgi:hypothetical protein